MYPFEYHLGHVDVMKIVSKLILMQANLSNVQRSPLISRNTEQHYLISGQALTAENKYNTPSSFVRNDNHTIT